MYSKEEQNDKGVINGENDMTNTGFVKVVRGREREKQKQIEDALGIKRKENDTLKNFIQITKPKKHSAKIINPRKEV